MADNERVAGRPSLGRPTSPLAFALICAALAATVVYMVYSIYRDVQETRAEPTTWTPFPLMFVALLITLGFEFANGFHDAANAVATAIYTNAMPAGPAAVWSGIFNFLGLLLSSGAVAFGIVSLLPVELMLKVGFSAGFAMVIALLIAAILWNLGTWRLGIPASSSHTLIGSIVGVGVANSILSGGAGGVDWDQATKWARRCCSLR